MEELVEPPPGPKNNWQGPITLACVFLGVLVALQFRVQTSIRAAPADRKDTVALIKSLESERNKLSDELTKARSRMEEIEQKLTHGSALSRELTQQMTEARMQAGLTAMRGPGVVVRMADSPRHPGPEEDPYFYLVHDVDLQALVNELWAAGAEAVSINDQRIVNRTSIRCVGPTILINTVRLGAPYVVKAIGPAQNLDSGLRMPGGFLDSMSMLIKSGGEVKIAQANEVEVPPYQGSMGYRYAQPVPESPVKAE